MNKVPPAVLVGFTDLADYSATKRAEGVCLMVEAVASIGEETERAAVVAYSLKRLVRGLSSSRQAARLGFAVALGEFIRRIDTVNVKEVTALMETILRIDSSSGGKLNALGFVMGLLALIETREVIEPDDPLLPFLIRHVLAMHKKFGSCNFYFLQPLVSALEKCTKEAISQCWYPSVKNLCRPSGESTFLDSLYLVIAVKLHFPKFAASGIPLCQEEKLFGNENLLKLSQLFKNSNRSSIVHPCVPTLVKVSLRSERFCQFWTIVMSEFISRLIKSHNFQDSFEIVDVVLQESPAKASNVEVVLTPEYFVSLLTCTNDNPALDNDELESVRLSLTIHMEKIQQHLLQLSSARVVNSFVDAVLTSGSPLGQKTRLKLLEKCSSSCGAKVANGIFKKVVERIKGSIPQSDVVLLSKLIVRLFKNDDDGELRVKIIDFLLRSVLSILDASGSTAVLKEQLTSAYFSILFQIFMANMVVSVLSEGFESSQSDETLNAEELAVLSKTFNLIRALGSVLDDERRLTDRVTWPLYCVCTFVLSSFLLDRNTPRKLLEELIKCGEDLQAADDSRKDEQVKLLISYAVAMPENVQHKCKALCLMIFSYMCPILRFDHLSPLFARLESCPNNEQNCRDSEEESEEEEDDLPLDPSTQTDAEEKMELTEQIVDLADLDDLDVTDGLMDFVVGRSSSHGHTGESNNTVSSERYSTFELVRLFVTKSSDSAALLRVLVELLRVAFQWASRGRAANDNCLFARAFRCLQEVRKRKLSFADASARREASEIICSAVRTIFELSTSVSSLNRRKAALDDQLTKSLLFLFKQGRTLGTPDSNHERPVRELAESLLLEQCSMPQNASRVASQRLGAACFHALPVLARCAMEDGCDPHKRIQYLRVCISVLSNNHSLTYLGTEEAKSLWESFSEELKRGFFLFHDVVFPSVGTGSVDPVPWDANYFLTLMELFLQLSKVAKHVDLAALVDEDFLLRLRHFNRPKFWSQPQARKIKFRIRRSYPLGPHKFLADLYRALRSGATRFIGF
uniref:Ribosomal RNA-processing protein 12-like conserved domain-containing protein n=1 Tax=Trichuris muris TaxID=70415 RepID=A0A5S6QHD0_TRIMR